MLRGRSISPTLPRRRRHKRHRRWGRKSSSRSVENLARLGMAAKEIRAEEVIRHGIVPVAKAVRGLAIDGE